MMIQKDKVRPGQQWPNGQVVTEVRGVFVATTAQLRVDESEAATFAYLITGVSRTKPDHLILAKHPNIKGQPARKAIGA